MSLHQIQTNSPDKHHSQKKIQKTQTKLNKNEKQLIVTIDNDKSKKQNKAQGITKQSKKSSKKISKKGSKHITPANQIVQIQSKNKNQETITLQAVPIVKNEINQTQQSNQGSFIKLQSLKKIKIQQDLNKVKTIIRIQKQISQNHKKFDKIEKQLQQIDNKIKSRKKTLLKSHIQQLQHKKQERQKFNKISNSRILQVKQKRKQKKQNQLTLHQKYKKQYAEKYELMLKQRKQYLKPINLEEIKQHQKQYILKKSNLNTLQLVEDGKFLQSKQKNRYRKAQKIRRSIRVKSQMTPDSNNQDLPNCTFTNEFQNLNLDKKSMIDQRIKQQIQQLKQRDQRKKENILKMIQKRLQYGNRVQKQRKNVRVKTQVSEHDSQHSKINRYYSRKRIQKQHQEKILSDLKKPRLDTNLRSCKESLNPLFDGNRVELLKLNKSKLSSMDKLLKLKSIEQRYQEKLKNKNPQAIQALAQLSLAKAKIYLEA